MSVLMHANREWESRPADERYSSLASMYEAAKREFENAGRAIVPIHSLRAEASGEGIIINGSTGRQANLTNWSFGQLAQKAKAPAGYLRSLPAPLAADCLNAGIKVLGIEDEAMLLFQRGGTDLSNLKLRGLTSVDYSRIWNHEVIERLIGLENEGTFQPAPAAFDGSRGLYLGDRDMFAFMVDNDRRIFEKGPGGGLSRGFFMWNSIVGARSIGVATFLYEYVCGNHRVWGASDVKEMRIAHIHTDTEKAFSKLAVELKRYAESSAEDDEAKVEAAHKFEIAATKDEVIDAVFKMVSDLSRKRIGEAYDKAEERQSWYGNPNTAWGLAGGLTEIARDLPNADERATLDKAAGKVMEMAF